MNYYERHIGDYLKDTAHLSRYVLRLDGFVSVHAPYAGGELVTKPFRFEELLARVRLRLRDDRSTGDDSTAAMLTVGSLSLDLRSRRVRVDGSEVELTAREFALMETFMRNPGRVLSRMELLSSAWGYDFDPNSNVVDVYVRYLRQKLGDGVIETVRGMGYRLVT